MKHKLKSCYLTLCTVLVTIAMLSFVLRDDIVLLDEPLLFKPNGFYIDKVTDERPGKESVATIAIGSKTIKPVLREVNLKDGAAPAIARFIARNLEKNMSEIPVSIAVKEIKLTETILPNGGIDGRVTLSLSFGQLKNYGTQQLVNYTGNSHYVRTLNDDKAVELRLRSIITSGLVYFNNWMAINLPVNPKLAKAVKFSFTDYSDKVEGDTIYYSASRPLTWKDFQSKIRPDGPFEAVVMPSFGYELKERIEGGVIHVQLALKTYVAKSDCWVGGTRSNYALAHEQRHFDIARIITRQYQQKITNAGLTPDTYQAFISMQYLDSYRDMNAMQRAYDKETRHGLDTFAQSNWNKKVVDLLKE